MTRWLLNRRAWVLVLAAGAMPLGMVGDCGYTPGVGGTFYYDDDSGHRHSHGGHGGVLIIEEYGYDDVYYEEEIIYEEVIYEDGSCDPFFFDCWY